MKKVIDLSSRRRAQIRANDPELDRMMRLSDELDVVLQAALNNSNIESKNIASVLAHRLGYLISLIPLNHDDKDALINYVIELILKLNAKSS